MTNLFLVMAGGAIGAGARYLFSTAFAARVNSDLPYATLSINIVGGLLMGLLVGFVARGGMEPVRLFIGVGLLGGFTTFSAFSLESFAMIERGQIGLAAGYGAASVIGSIIALAIGLSFARTVTL